MPKRPETQQQHALEWLVCVSQIEYPLVREIDDEELYIEAPESSFVPKEED